MEKKIIVLANSKRDNGRCIAGICSETGDWIRPLYEGRARRSIDEEEVGKIDLLDIIRIHLTKSESESELSNNKHPVENYFIDSRKIGNWEKVNDKNIAERIKYIRSCCENDKPILHSNKKEFSENEMDKIRVEHWKSLMLIEKEVKFVCSKKYNRWYGNFDTQNGENIHLTLTDPNFECILENEPNKKNGNYILAISLAENPSKHDNCYHKLIAGVIDPELF